MYNGLNKLFINTRYGISVQIGYCIISTLLVMSLHACSLACDLHITKHAIIYELSHMMIDCVPLLIVFVGVIACICKHNDSDFVTKFHHLCGFLSVIYLLTSVSHDAVEAVEEKFTNSSCDVHHTEGLYLTIHAFKHSYVVIFTIFIIGLVYFIDDQSESFILMLISCCLNHLYGLCLVLVTFLENIAHRKVLSALNPKIFVFLVILGLGVATLMYYINYFLISCPKVYLKKVQDLERILKVPDSLQNDRKIVHQGNGTLDIFYKLSEETFKAMPYRIPVMAHQLNARIYFSY